MLFSNVFRYSRSVPEQELSSSVRVDRELLDKGVPQAAAELGADLRPDRTVLYGPPPWQEIRRESRLSRDGEVSVVLRERFWSGDLLGEARLVPPLLAYADALADAEPREMTARPSFGGALSESNHPDEYA